VPRGSFQARTPGRDGFSELGRFVLDRLNRGIILIDPDRHVIEANSFARELISACGGREDGGRTSSSCLPCPRA
jgi:hypothetical protein